MTEKNYSNCTFEKENYTEKHISGKDFEQCRFVCCDFTNADLSNNNFLDCEFESCNLSMIKINNTGVKTVNFKNCKVIGVDFSNCKDFLFAVAFDNCCLDYSYFLKRKMKQTKFTKCLIREANFGETDLTNSVFSNCDLDKTIFYKTNLSQTDFRTAINFSIDPELNKIKKAKFSMHGLAGLLYKYEIIID